MRFSVIVPIYNISTFLPQCIESILEQTYPHFELILVDDGSTDNSEKICDEYAGKDKRITVIHKANGGLVSARQAGAKQARGEYIVAVDGDDWVENSLLKDIEKILQQYSVDIICYDSYRAFTSQQKQRYSSPFRAGYYTQQQIQTEILPHLIRGKDGSTFIPNIWGKAFKREICVPVQLSVNPRITMCEDGAVTWPCISKANSLYLLKKTYYNYRINSDSMSRTRKRGFPWNNCHLVLRQLETQLENLSFFQLQLDRFICHALFCVVKSHLQTTRPYQEVKANILEHLALSENQQVIQNAKFSFLCKDWFAQLSLKYRQIWLIKLYAMLEQRWIKK